MPNEPLSRAQILEALSELAARLSTRGQQARIYIVGGAAIAISFNSRDLTRDVDAQYTPAMPSKMLPETLRGNTVFHPTG